MTDIITHELLKSWNPCTSGYRRFCELFPDGATLQSAIDGLIADNHDDWGYWLFSKCKELSLFGDVVAKGYRNSGDRNSGDYNSGHYNSGDRNSGHYNSGHYNSGHYNSGDRNSGHYNSGHYNSGDYNSGHYNSGDRNSGHYNSGHRNSGDRNSGDYNSGRYNSGDYNSGFFNTDTPSEIRVFNKPCLRSAWESASIPSFLHFSTTTWICDESMSDQEKIDNPKFFVAGGYLKTTTYKEAFQAAYANASDEDKALLLKLPNFDADLFFEISGIRV